MLRFLRVTMLWVLLLPYAVRGVGAASNQLVIFANHDTFPVSINLIKLADWSHGGKAMHIVESFSGVDPQGHIFVNDNMHVVMTEQTHLNLLADIFDFHSNIASVGDLLIELGDWLNGFAFYVWFTLVVNSLYQRRRYDDEAA